MPRARGTFVSEISLSEEKASRVCVDMGSHLLTKQFWLFPCEGRIAQ